MSGSKTLLYIVYGTDPMYYKSVKFSILSLMNFISQEDKINIVVLSEKPEEFSSYPIKVIPITQEQKDEWSLNNKYHFRIKNRGLKFILEYLKLNEEDKVLYIDADSYFKKSPLDLFDLINSNQALLYVKEGLIYQKKRYKAYVDSLNNINIPIENYTYTLSKTSAMWGSAIVGITVSMKHNIDFADKLMLKFIEMVPSHTVEQFSLAESLSKEYNLVSGKKLINLYSTSAKMEYAKKILINFFKEYSNLPLEEQIKKASKTKITRPIGTIITQRLKKLFTTGESLW